VNRTLVVPDKKVSFQTRYTTGHWHPVVHQKVVAMFKIYTHLQLYKLFGVSFGPSNSSWKFYKPAICVVKWFIILLKTVKLYTISGKTYFSLSDITSPVLSWCRKCISCSIIWSTRHALHLNGTYMLFSYVTCYKGFREFLQLSREELLGLHVQHYNYNYILIN